MNIRNNNNNNKKKRMINIIINTVNIMITYKRCHYLHQQHTQTKNNNGYFPKVQQKCFFYFVTCADLPVFRSLP